MWKSSADPFQQYNGKIKDPPIIYINLFFLDRL